MFRIDTSSITYIKSKYTLHKIKVNK